MPNVALLWQNARRAHRTILSPCAVRHRGRDGLGATQRDYRWGRTPGDPKIRNFAVAAAHVRCDDSLTESNEHLEAIAARSGSE